MGIWGGSAIDGNVQTFLNHMLDLAKKGGSKTQAFHLSDYKVAERIYCNFCLSRQRHGEYCSLGDHPRQIFDMI